MKLAEISKALAAAGAAATVAVSSGILDPEAGTWVIGGIATVAAFVVTYAAPTNRVPK